MEDNDEFVNHRSDCKRLGHFSNMCRYFVQGRVEGAIMMGNRWFIPKDSPKPEDKRRTKNVSD